MQGNPALMKEYISISKLELERLNTLVDKAIAIDIPDEQSLKNSMQKLNLKEELAGIVRVYQVKFTEYEGQLTFNFNGSEFNVLADIDHLSNVFYNLLDNAIKYKSEKNINVSIDLVERDAILEIRIKDNGLGMNTSYHQNIFDKFFRIPQDNHHNVKGHGLGLHYVQKIINLHEGSVRVESEIAKEVVLLLNCQNTEMEILPTKNTIPGR